MKRALPLLIIGILFHICSISNLKAQANKGGILFIFDSKEKLTSVLESDNPKEIVFQISGIETGKQAKDLKSNLLANNKRVTAFKLSRNGNKLYTGDLSLTADSRTSHFTKILISCGIWEIMVEGQKTLTVELNGK